ncbi:MobQ family relaxase [Jannaschia marina]|uniref:MobQ family relaxase n=1 Tax=Jannaschia marina TaxID=2741674 RepID=UPI0015CE59B3|nr:MobQ family relaxase [Jannaschia marina]
MAIYHLRASVISRSQGRSATAAIAYRVAERITDRRTGLVFDYAAKAGVEHTEILAPSHAPDWVSDRSELWNRVEEAETRKNSQVAREVRVALPDELSHAERVELVRGFVREQFVERGMVADVAIHAPGREGDERNHHAHILLTTREVGENGFTAKNRDWNKVEVLASWREAWARDTNAALERAQVAERVDHRTLAAQREEALEMATAARDCGDEREELAQTVRAVELDRSPLPQLSPGAWQMKERGHEVGRVAAWHEAKARAAEVREIAADLAREVGTWIAERAAGVVDRVRERVGPGQDELALVEGSVRREAPEDSRDLATRLRAAWDARQGASHGQERAAGAEGPERSEVETAGRDGARDAPTADGQDLAERLRAAAAGIDRDGLAERVAALREGREAEERQAAEAQALDAAREREREIELEKEKQAERNRDSGWDYGL